MRNSILRNINKLMLCTSSKYLDECVEAKNNILDIADELESEIRSKDAQISRLLYQVDEQSENKTELPDA